ncbi:MAG: HAMP domain-containing histidine kinase [Ignavibacteria bacterium]|nr:HAMP domain-containing histidine kinase [Ignavibacteria bacterium]
MKNNLSIKNRIALFFMIATAILITLLFATIYVVVYNTVFNHLDSDLEAESIEVHRNLVILNDRFVITNSEEWMEKEHRQIEVNPTFVEIVDRNGNLTKKTGNLLYGNLKFDPSIKTKKFFDARLSGAPIRQLQMPIENPSGLTLGYLIIAIPLEESALVLRNLRNVLAVAIPLVLILLYFITKFIAGKSMAPIDTVISTAEKITKENIDKRIELPVHKDELYTLTYTINDLLDRLQDAVLREKQFTSDASHELRTPLAVLKGTLEVLVRKPRSTEQYETKIKYCIDEVNRMSNLVDQLLMLARYESGKTEPKMQKIDIAGIIEHTILRMQHGINAKRISLSFDSEAPVYASADEAMLEIILDNIISNSVKYSGMDTSINITLKTDNGKAVCTIQDCGIGMEEEEIEKIFDRFYRIDESRSSRISGSGLGLAIVKKLADLQKLRLRVESKPGNGTTFSIYFND